MTPPTAAHRDLLIYLLAQKLVFHKANLSTCEPKMEGFCLCFVRLSHIDPKQPLAALTVYDIHVT